MLDEKTVLRRIAGRTAAKEMLSLLSAAELGDLPFMQAFVEEVQKLPIFSAVILAKRKKRRPLAQLNAITLAFGKYSGVPLSEVPPSYLRWLLDSSRETVRDVKEYLSYTDLNRDVDDDDGELFDPDDPESGPRSRQCLP